MVESVYGADGQFEESVLIRYGGDLDDPNVSAGLRAIEASMMPAAKNDILPKLAMLWEMTSHAQSGGDNLKLKFAGYCQNLMEYPADVVFEAIQRWQRREKWWPAWADLKAECDRLVQWRRVTRDALRGAI